MAETKKKIVKKKRATKNQFKKGVGGNPFGRPKMTDTEKELSIKTRTQFRTMLSKYMVTDKKKLKALVKRNDIPAIDAMIIKSLVKTFEGGDQNQINWFLNHVMGKEKEVTNIKLETNDTTNLLNVKKMSKEELLALKQIQENQTE